MDDAEGRTGVDGDRAGAERRACALQQGTDEAGGGIVTITVDVQRGERVRGVVQEEVTVVELRERAADDRPFEVAAVGAGEEDIEEVVVGSQGRGADDLDARESELHRTAQAEVRDRDVRDLLGDIGITEIQARVALHVNRATVQRRGVGVGRERLVGRRAVGGSAEQAEQRVIVAARATEEDVLVIEDARRGHAGIAQRVGRDDAAGDERDRGGELIDARQDEVET